MPLPQALEQLARLSSVMATKEGKVPTENVVAVEISPAEVLVDLSRYVSKQVEGVVGSLKSLSATVIETGGAIEKKQEEPGWASLAKYAPHIAGGIGAVIALLMVMQLLQAYLFR